LGAFWNSHGGMVMSDRRLSKKEVVLLKRTWSRQLRSSEDFCNGWWRKTKKIVASFGAFMMSK
jgi:hypothetical protein